MALSLKIVLDTGVAIDYWVIDVTNISWKDMVCDAYLSGYLNIESYHNGMKPVSYKTFHWQDTHFTFLPGINIIEECYNKIISLPEWKDAEIVE